MFQVYFRTIYCQFFYVPVTLVVKRANYTLLCFPGSSLLRSIYLDNSLGLVNILISKGKRQGTQIVINSIH